MQNKFWILIARMFLGLVLVACSPTVPRVATLASTSTLPPTATYTSSPIPTLTLTPTQTLTPLPPTPTLGLGSTMVSEKDGATIIYVPAGEFIMGLSSELPHPQGNDSPSYKDNIPQSTLLLDAFWIDQTEVTNRQYAMCVTSGKCEPPTAFNSPTRPKYFKESVFENYPVIYVDWEMAVAYCKWTGRRLPTEAEWEKAARGPDGNIYPWGNVTPNDALLNYDSAVRDTTEVGKYLDGRSIYGAYDMAGNVWEWTSSLYKPYPYDPNDGREDFLAKELRVLRGGSWNFFKGSPRSIFRFGVLPVDTLVRSDLRSWSLPTSAGESIYSIAPSRAPYGFGTVGFRCAMSATP
jgi:eukaryotic-like serine/threonine-protein kinase